MQMIMLFSLFPDVARQETRSITVPEPTATGVVPPLPAGRYGFAECFCVDPECDCRRVVVAVLSERHKRQVAAINHAFEKPAKGSIVKEQTFLDPLNPQSSGRIPSWNCSSPYCVMTPLTRPGLCGTTRW